MKYIMLCAILLSSVVCCAAASQDAFIEGWRNGDIECILQALKDGANPNVTIDECEPLVYAITLSLTGFDNYVLVKALVDAGARCDTTVSVNGQTITLDALAAECIRVIQDFYTTVSHSEEYQAQERALVIELCEKQLNCAQRVLELIKQQL